jgi:uncharacterized membrane protein
MNRVALGKVRLGTNRFAEWGRGVHWALFGLFLAQWLLVCSGLWLSKPLFAPARWPEGLLLVLAAATTLAGLTRWLPGQNMMLAALLIMLLSGAVASVGALTGMPFGPISYTRAAGQCLFEPLPWSVPMVWLVLLLNSRGVARLILRPWRQGRNYGLWLLGLTVLLVVLLEAALEPFATQVKGYWHWQATKLPLDWYTTPLVNFFAWGVSTLLILAFTTPALLKKKPGLSPPDYHPLWMWLLLNLLFLSGAVTHHLWTASALVLTQSLLTASFAIRGGRS